MRLNSQSAKYSCFPSRLSLEPSICRILDDEKVVKSVSSFRVNCWEFSKLKVVVENTQKYG